MGNWSYWTGKVSTKNPLIVQALWLRNKILVHLAFDETIDNDIVDILEWPKAEFHSADWPVLFRFGKIESPLHKSS
jgi:hypothetical protein